MSEADDPPSVVSMIPAPTNWQSVRSTKAIPGMSDAEKLEFQKALRLQKAKYLDESKVYGEQDGEQLKKVADAVCAQYPFLMHRYEGAWPVEALLRSRLQTSASSARRPGARRSLLRMSMASRMKPKNGVSTPADLLPDAQNEEIKDELDSSPELEEHLPPHHQAGPSQPTAPSRSTQFGIQLQAHEPAVDTQHSSSHEDTPRPATPAAEQADSVPCLDMIRALGRSPRPLPSSQRALRQSTTKPRQDRADARTLPAVVPLPGMVARHMRALAGPRMLSSQPDAGVARAVPQPPSASLPLPSSDAGSAAPAAPRPPSSDVSSDATAVQRGQDADAGERIVRDFLHSLVQPLDDLLPLFLQAGVRDQACLKGLAGLSQEQKLQLLRLDLELNILQSRIILDGLSRIS